MSLSRKILLVPRIEIINANALSSPFTIGFPAMTAWMGAVHALQRKLNDKGYKDLVFEGAGVVNHHFDLQVNDEQSDRNLKLMKRAPTSRDEKDTLNKGDPARFVPEAKCHLTVSLAVEVKQLGFNDTQKFVQDVRNSVLGAMKMAGGDVINLQEPRLVFIDEKADQDTSSLMNDLMPGQALIERRDLVIEGMEQGLDAIDAVMDYLVIHHQSHLQKIENKNKKSSDDKEKDKTDKGQEEQAPEEPKLKVVWTKNRKARGWIVPVACGFQQLTTPSLQNNQRDRTTPHAFAESIVTLGEFIAPYKLKTLKDLLWTTDIVEQNNTQLYVCHQNNTTN